jgi:hypothetical protein
MTTIYLLVIASSSNNGVLSQKPATKEYYSIFSFIARKNKGSLFRVLQIQPYNSFDQAELVRF